MSNILLFQAVILVGIQVEIKIWRIMGKQLKLETKVSKILDCLTKL